MWVPILTVPRTVRVTVFSNMSMSSYLPRFRNAALVFSHNRSPLTHDSSQISSVIRSSPKPKQLDSTHPPPTYTASPKPTLVIYPLFCTDIYTLSARASLTLTTMAATFTATATTTDFPALLQTSTLTLAMVIILRFRGKCPQYLHYEDELTKRKNGSLKPITREMVYNRPHNCDLEKGVDIYEKNGLSPFDEHVSPVADEGKQFNSLQRAQSLADLEGRGPYEYQEKETVGDRALRHLRNSQLRAAKVQRDSGWTSNIATIDEDEEPKDLEKEKEEVGRTAREWSVEEPAPAHPSTRTADEETTLQ